MSKGTILIVDDKKLLRDSLADFLQANGYTIQEADSGERAIDTLRSGQVDIVLLDEILPGISGLRTLQLIRKLRPNQVVIGLTGEITVKVIEDYLSAGALDILAKSAIYEQLLPLLDTARDRAATARTPTLDHYPEAAAERKAQGRWEEAAVYLKEAGIEEKLLGNGDAAETFFRDAVDCFTRAGRTHKAKEVEDFFLD